MYREPAVLPIPLALEQDPWTLAPQARQQLRDELTESQVHWLPRLRALVEPPAPDDVFPAFLLDTAPFARLREAVGAARCRGDLDTGTADELQRFVDLYRSYRIG